MKEIVQNYLLEKCLQITRPFLDEMIILKMQFVGKSKIGKRDWTDRLTEGVLVA